MLLLVLIRGVKVMPYYTADWTTMKYCSVTIRLLILKVGYMNN